MEQPWTLLFHQCLIDQLDRLTAAADRARAANPKTAHENANVKLHAALARLILETIPGDPASDEFRLGNTLGAGFVIGGAPKSVGAFVCFFDTIRDPG